MRTLFLGAYITAALIFSMSVKAGERYTRLDFDRGVTLISSKTSETMITMQTQDELDGESEVAVEPNNSDE